MSTPLDFIHRILFLDLRQLCDSNSTEAKFKSLLIDISEEHYIFQPSYQTDFPKPLTSKRKYFLRLINNDTISFLNALHKNINDSLNDNEKKYWISLTLKMATSQKLKDTNSIISENNYELELLNSSDKSIRSDTGMLDKVFIYNYLKQELVRVYFEIQDTYSNYINPEEILTLANLYEIYFNENLPSKSPFLDADKINLPTPLSKTIPKEAKPVFKAIKGDFRGTAKILDYVTIVKNPDYFAQFEESLFIHDFINKDYNFKPIHNQINQLACIYNALIKKGYFNTRDFKKKKTIKPIDVRKFLDDRYNANLEKQFRTFASAHARVSEFISATFWIDQLPAC